MENLNKTKRYFYSRNIDKASRIFFCCEQSVVSSQVRSVSWCIIIYYYTIFYIKHQFNKTKREKENVREITRIRQSGNITAVRLHNVKSY